ncbi:unnamed protein product, partial [Didymodactylos carnosus]
MSKVQLSQQHLQVLSKGLKFVPTPKAVHAATNIVKCEKALYSTSLALKTAAISEMTTFIQQWTKSKKLDSYKEMKLLNEIKSVEDIVIVQADKG